MMLLLPLVPDPTPGSGWGARDIAEAAAVLGTSKVATAVMALIALFIVARYIFQPWLASRSKSE